MGNTTNKVMVHCPIPTDPGFNYLGTGERLSGRVCLETWCTDGDRFTGRPCRGDNNNDLGQVFSFIT